jgi:hypothetical protein
MHVNIVALKGREKLLTSANLSFYKNNNIIPLHDPLIADNMIITLKAQQAAKKINPCTTTIQGIHFCALSSPGLPLLHTFSLIPTPTKKHLSAHPYFQMLI